MSPNWFLLAVIVLQLASAAWDTFFGQYARAGVMGFVALANVCLLWVE